MPVAAGARIYAGDIPIEDYPIGRCTQVAAQSIPDATITALQWTTEDFDTHGQHDPVTLNTRIVPNLAGYYEFHGAYYSASPTTLVNMDAFLRKNGTGSLPSGDRGQHGSIAQSMSCHFIQPMNGTTDYMELCAFQDSAGAVLTNVSSRFTSYIEWKYLRPL